MTIPTTEQILGGGGPAAKFEAPGDAIEGTIIHKDVNQETDYKTGEKKFYPRSGDPMWQIIATLQTNLREDSEDDGLRRVFFKSGLMRALRETLRAQKLKDIEVGGWTRVIHTGLGIPEGGGNAPKLYIVEYRSASAQVIGGPAQQAPQAETYQAPVAGYQPSLQQQAPIYQQPAPQQGVATQQAQQPTPEQVAALLSADPSGAMLRKVYPGYVG